jgi:signal peptidase I
MSVPWKPVRVALRALAGLAILFVALVVLDRTGLLQLNSQGGTSSMARTLPPCNGRVIAEGFTYKFRDPHRGEIVMLHARGSIGSVVTPDRHGKLGMNKRVVGLPGELLDVRRGRVFADGSKVDDIATKPFPPVRLGRDEYFVLGDNRSASQDSSWPTFGPVPRNTIFARVVLIVWPFGRFGAPRYDKHARPPGEGLCR